MLHHYNEKNNINNKNIKFGYLFKKYNNQHSQFVKISIYDKPKIVIKNMIKEFKIYLQK